MRGVWPKTSGTPLVMPYLLSNSFYIILKIDIIINGGDLDVF